MEGSLAAPTPNRHELCGGRWDQRAFFLSVRLGSFLLTYTPEISLGKGFHQAFGLWEQEREYWLFFQSVYKGYSKSTLSLLVYDKHTFFQLLQATPHPSFVSALPGPWLLSHCGPHFSSLPLRI